MTLVHRGKNIDALHNVYDNRQKKTPLFINNVTQYRGDYCFDKYSQSSVSSVGRLPRTHEAVMVF